MKKENVEKKISAGLVILATGRQPVKPEGIEKLGLNMDNKGNIIVDDGMRTNIQNVFATGDVNGKAPYFHAAVRMSIAAANNIMSKYFNTDYVDIKSIPVTVFAFPPASYVGLTGSELKKRGIEYIEASYDLSKDVEGQVYEEDFGKLKLFFEKGTLRLLGGWVVGINAETIINEIGLSVSKELTARDLANFAEQHPITNELISYTARKIL
jgi:dihydrolipoamide dehydrogenase